MIIIPLALELIVKSETVYLETRSYEL